MFSPKVIFCLAYLHSQIQSSGSEHILFYNVVSSYSHRIACWPWVEQLAARGHNVTFLQQYPPKIPNPLVREFYPRDLEDIWAFEEENGKKSSDNGFLVKRIHGGPTAVMEAVGIFPTLGVQTCANLLSNAEMTEFIKSNKFDLVVIDFLFNDCAYGLAHKWGAKAILYFSTHPSGSFAMETLGFLGTDEFEMYSTMDNTGERGQSFLQKVHTLLIICMIHLMKEWSYYPSLDAVLREKLSMPDMPGVSEMVKQTDLVLYNSHFSEELARSLPPSFVAVPAMHAWGTKVQPLPKEMAEFVDASGENGFIYVSFGGLADISTAPIEFQNMFMKAFAGSKVRFLWKRGGERPKDVPENVYIGKWMPQKDILASPKCRGFITHGGLLGTQEAVMNGVPMIAMPIFGEQDYNAARIQETGRGLMLEVSTLTEEELTGAIQEILNNKKYKENVMRVSRQLKDQQNSPIDTAVFWTEYVLRHDRNDLSRLRPKKYRHSYWWQLNFLDVWVFLIFAALTTLYGIFWIMKAIWFTLRRAFRHNAANQKLKRN